MALRLGDDVDDYCVKCKRVTNHSILSMVESEPAKVRCRTCYAEQHYRKCEIPPSKKDLKKAALFAQVLNAIPAAAEAAAAEPVAELDLAPAVEPAAVKTKGKKASQPVVEVPF